VAGNDETLVLAENWRVEEGRAVHLDVFYFDPRPLLEEGSSIKC
jgi:hypothetical protein